MQVSKKVLTTGEEGGEVGRGFGVAVGVDVEGENAHPGVVSDHAEFAHTAHDLKLNCILLL